MRGKILLAIGFFIATGMTMAKAQVLTTPVSKYLRYTVNHARSTPFELLPTSTVVNIINRSAKTNDITLAFYDQNGALKCLAAGPVNSGQSRVFGTFIYSDGLVSPAPFDVNFPAFLVANANVSPPTTTQDICNEFEGRVEIHSKYAGLQVAPWIVINGMPTAIPMQAKKQSSKGGH